MSDQYTGQDVAFYGSSPILDGYSNAPVKVCVDNHYKDKTDFDVNYFSCRKTLGLVSSNVAHVCLDNYGSTYYANAEYLEIQGVDFSTYSNYPNFMSSSWASRWACAFGSRLLIDMVAIIDIMRHRPRSLYICGLDLEAETEQDSKSYIPEYSKCGTYKFVPHLIFLKQLESRTDVHFANYPLLDSLVRKKGFVSGIKDQYIDVENPSILKQYSIPAIHRSA